MGRFYKATPSQFIENKMFQLDPATMFKAVETVDKNINEVWDKGEQGLKDLKSESLDVDDPAVRERMRYHQDNIEGIYNEMNKDILSYKKQGGKMRGVSREISSDLNSGVFFATKGNLADHKEMIKEIDADKNLTAEQKSLKKEYIMHKFKGDGGTSYDYETGEHNKIKNYDEQLVGGIEDIDKYISAVLQNFDYDNVKGRKSGVGTGKLAGKDVIYTTTNTLMERSEEDIIEYFTNSLNNKDFKTSREQVHKMRIEMGHEELGLNEDGTVMSEEETAKQLAQKDFNRVLNQALAEGAKTKGDKRSTVKGMNSIEGSSRTTTDSPIGTGFVDTTKFSPSNIKNTVVSTDNKLNQIFSATKKQGTMTSAEEVDLLNLGKLNSLGFTSSEQMYSSTMINYSEVSLDNLVKGLALTDPVYNTTDTLGRRALASNWLTEQDKKNSRKQPIHNSKVPLASMTSDEKKTVSKEHKEYVKLFNATTDTEDIFLSVYMEDDNGNVTSIDAKSVADIEKKARENGTFYIPSTSKVTQLAEARLDKTNTYVINKETGDVAVAPYEITKKNIKQGQKLTKAQASNFSDIKLDYVRPPAIGVTDRDTRFLQADESNYRQVVNKKFYPNGLIKNEKKLVYSYQYYKVNEAGEKSLVTFTMNVDPSKFITN